MRAVFIGAGSLTEMTALQILRHGHDVVIIERDKARIDALGEILDCGWLHGDGTKPALQKEANPAATDCLFCLTGDDRSNIIASLVGRSLKFPCIVTKIKDPDFEHICLELGIENVIIPSRTIGRYLTDVLEGRDPVELSAMVREDARVFSFVARDTDAGAVTDLDLPKGARLVCLYRDGRFAPIDEDTAIESGDEVMLITHHRHLAKLTERFRAEPGADGGG